MSADNGYVIRPDGAGQFVLQHYFASADDWPEITPDLPRYSTPETAFSAYNSMSDNWSEYGLTVVRETENK
jgi:hypothetical protein